MKGGDTLTSQRDMVTCRRLSLKTGAMDIAVNRSRVLMLLWILLGVATVSEASNSYVWADTKVATTSDITCWTCSGKANNEECNTWAPDLKCPLNHTVCQTVHTFGGPRRSSVRVTKSCVQPTECTPKQVGCSQPDSKGQQECTSCCDFSYCNKEVPVNLRSALNQSAFTKASASNSPAVTSQPSCLLLLASVLIASLHVLPTSGGHRLWHLNDDRIWTLHSWRVR